MEKEIAQMLKYFLGNTTLHGTEVPSFNKCVFELDQVIFEKPKQEEEYSEDEEEQEDTEEDQEDTEDEEEQEEKPKRDIKQVMAEIDSL